MSSVTPPRYTMRVSESPSIFAHDRLYAYSDIQKMTVTMATPSSRCRIMRRKNRYAAPMKTA